MDLSENFKVASSEGDLIVRPNGTIVNLEKAWGPQGDGEYPVRFDIREWRENSPYRDILPWLKEIDILDLSFWTNKGNYDSAGDSIWRREIRSVMAADMAEAKKAILFIADSLVEVLADTRRMTAAEGLLSYTGPVQYHDEAAKPKAVAVFHSSMAWRISEGMGRDLQRREEDVVASFMQANPNLSWEMLNEVASTEIADAGVDLVVFLDRDYGLTHDTVRICADICEGPDVRERILAVDFGWQCDETFRENAAKKIAELPLPKSLAEENSQKPAAC